MNSFIPVHSRFAHSISYNLAGPVLVTHDPTTAVLVTTRRAREGKCLGALEFGARIFGAQLRRKSGQFHLLPHIRNPYLTTQLIPSTFCRSSWAMNEVESLRLGGAADATDLARGSSKENEEERT